MCRFEGEAPLNSISVLLVDDEAEFVEALTRRLKLRQIDVDGVQKGRDALAFLEQKPVDVVVLNPRMPDMGGIETLKEIKLRYPDIEVIILTGHANQMGAVEGIQMGVFDYLLKPIRIDQLLYRIQDAYQHKIKTV
jgi:DNA-binding NtrC family response regulator